MKYRPVWAPQPEAFIKSLPPEPKRSVSRALKQLASGHMEGLDVRPLEGTLRGYMRLRVMSYRVIYVVSADKRGPVLRIVAAGPRSTVYHAFEKVLAEQRA